ncbi:MAG TPA: hypothetical protein VLQ80_31280 [Candidatus Saccharimonadia bacterium]|nr:hypothetical protein [Candidatus Saccharimonadia bacterium]
MIPLFYGAVEHGKVTFSANERQLFQDYLVILEGKEFQLALEKRKQTRTLP